VHLIVKLTGKGDEILYEVTVEDSDVLLEAWAMAPRALRLNKNFDAGLIPERPTAKCAKRRTSAPKSGINAGTATPGFSLPHVKTSGTASKESCFWAFDRSSFKYQPASDRRIDRVNSRFLPATICRALSCPLYAILSMRLLFRGSPRNRIPDATAR
jgi:hypothetical protein